jgi:hypothetical protein
MKKDLTDIIGSHKGLPGFVCGLGPSLGKYLDVFSKMSLNKGKNIFICCNEFDEMTNIDADYWVIANSVLVVEKFYNKFNGKPNTTLVYSDSVDLTNRDAVESLIKVDYIPYDQRHFYGLNCGTTAAGCCGHIINGRLTIQEHLMKISEYSEHYSAGSTVALHMLSLAVIMGLNPIYLVGVELDYRKGYVKPGYVNHDSFDQHLTEILNDFRIINESAKKMGVEIINLSTESHLNKIMTTKDVQFGE